MLYFTADPHLTDTRVHRICHRPSDTDMQFIENVNSTLVPGDTLHILGDLFSSTDKPTGFNNGQAFSEDGYDIPERLDIFRKLRRDIQKVMILGNHDDESFFRYFQSTFGFDILSPYMEIQIGDHQVWMAHDPSFSIIFPEKPLLCGHVHSLFRICRNALNVGVDQWRNRPVSEIEIQQALGRMAESRFTLTEI
jgi:calcineurin-like phosphoesterase family protein